MCCLFPSSDILVSLLMILCFIRKANAQAQGRSLWDECKNQTGKGLYLCGDVCLARDELCHCSDTILRYEYIPTRHCCTSDPCQNITGGGECPQGQVRDITKPCPDGNCYADFDNSYNYPGLARQNYVSYDKSFLSCPQREECLAIIKMCQGHSACGDKQYCHERLRCDIDKGEGIKSLNQSEIVIKHFYCQYHRYDGNSVYDTINREDENITNTLNPKAYVNYSSYLTYCPAEEGGGLTCYFNLNDLKNNKYECYHVASWCRSDRTYSCVIDKIGNKISSNDKTLCQDKLFWNKVTLTRRAYLTSEMANYAEGVRCNGSLMHMIYPWYKWLNGMPDVRVKQQCEDKSDQVFDSETPCPDLNHYLSIQNQIWCDKNWFLRTKEICTDPKSWIEKNKNKISNDPHNCQASCNETGPNCISCRNKNYFNCYLSGKCIHLDLKCDGHPQCPRGEDEEYEMCKKDYFRKRVVERFVTFKCESKVYPTIYTIATACNHIHECLNDADESLCDVDKYTTPVLVFLAFGILSLFISLKLPQLLDFRKKRKNLGRTKMFKESHFHDIIQKLQENPEDKRASRKINIFLLHILHTRGHIDQGRGILSRIWSIVKFKQMEANIVLSVLSVQH